MEINARLRDVATALKINQAEIARVTNTSSQAVSSIWRDRYQAKADFLAEVLINYPEINARWLLTGEGEMLNDANIVAEPSQAYATKLRDQRLADMEVLVHELREQIANKDKIIHLLEKQLERR